MMVHQSSSTSIEDANIPVQHTYKTFIQQHRLMILKYIKGDNFRIERSDYKLFELMRCFKENDWLIDAEAAKKIRNSKINVTFGFIKSDEVLEFLQSLNVVRINDLSFSTKEFTEADLDLVGMTVRNSSTLKVDFNPPGYSHYVYLSNDLDLPLGNNSKLRVSIHKNTKKPFVIVPNGIKSLFNKFYFQIGLFENSGMTEEETYDSMLSILSDLIEHVLENHENKQLNLSLIHI